VGVNLKTNIHLKLWLLDVLQNNHYIPRWKQVPSKQGIVSSDSVVVSFTNVKGATLATRAASTWGGVMIKLSGLSPCLLYSVFYFNSVVCCLLSVSY